MSAMFERLGKRKRDPSQHPEAETKPEPVVKRKKHGLHPLPAAERQKLTRYASFEERVLAEQRNELGTAGSDARNGQTAESWKSRNSRTLFVGNVDTSASKEEIEKLFARFGEIEDVRLRGIVSETRKRPKRLAAVNDETAAFLATGQAWVVFESHARVYARISEACKEMNMTVFKGKHLRVLPSSEKIAGPRRMSLFVGNLPFDCMEEELVEAFLPIADESGAKLVGARCNRDLDTGAGRGVGFVAFDDILGVQAAINKVGEIKIRGRVLRIENASKFADKRTKASKKQSRPFSYGRNRRGRGR